jgi:hypothetical protein
VGLASAGLAVTAAFFGVAASLTLPKNDFWAAVLSAGAAAVSSAYMIERERHDIFCKKCMKIWMVRR